MGADHVRKGTDEMKRKGERERKRSGGGQRARKDGEQRRRKCHPSVYIRATAFASSLMATSCPETERHREVKAGGGR